MDPDTRWFEIDSALVDTRYAIRQLREFRDPDRALDALERIEEILARLATKAVDAENQTQAEEESVASRNPTA